MNSKSVYVSYKLSGVQDVEQNNEENINLNYARE